MNTRSGIRSTLVIDDSSVQRMHAVELLRQVGVTHVLEADGGEQALSLLSSLSPDELPDVIVLDLEMPGMDGVQVIQRLRELDLLIPVIVASARDLLLLHTVEAMARSIGMPILGCLKKPLDRERLQRLLERRQLILNPAQRKRTGKSHVLAPMGLDATTLLHALRGRQLSMHYQPKVSLQSGQVHGFEALARWHHPELGMVPPDVFIPLAEREDLIRDLTLLLMSQCFAQMAQWSDEHGHSRPTMAINLSPLLLGDLKLVDEIGALMAVHGLHAGQFVLEITEGSLAPNMSTALAMLARLRLKGFGLSIDDYGTGFSSMQQLAQFPFTELKIDRSFVCGAHERLSVRVILQSAIDMSCQLGLLTVGEGIETLDDWHTLRDMGCVIGQGYLIAKPMPGDQVLHWLRAWNTGAGSSVKQTPLP